MAGDFMLFCLLAWFRGYNSESLTALWTNAGTTGSLKGHNAMTCASNYMGLEYGAVKMDAIVGGVCESLPFDWLTNQTFETDYLYMVKEWNKVTMIPALFMYWVSDTDNSRYTTYIPLVFEEGSYITVKFSDPSANLVINLFNEPETTQVLHVHMHGNSGAVVFAYYTNGGHQDNQVEFSLPHGYHSTCEVTLVAGSDYIDMNSNNALFYRYNITGKSPTTAVRKVHVGTPTGSQAFLHSIKFKAN